MSRNTLRAACPSELTFMSSSTNMDGCELLQGADSFTAKVNIEVQLASELAIAAIEKNGGVVTTAFYDPRSLGKLLPVALSASCCALIPTRLSGVGACSLDLSVFCPRLSYLSGPFLQPVCQAFSNLGFESRA